MAKTYDPTQELPDQSVNVKGMYKDYFLDYASYVILERAVPTMNDGLKPVQRRILHALREMDDGRFHKVANAIGQTMQYHPHGDAAIGEALVNLGQKDLLIDCQGNWGDVRTGDGAAAPRYIEARLTKFALEVAFNKQTTQWQPSYDGRKFEPITLPMKFPLLLAQGVEGIAVGLSTKVMSHNFIELLDACIAHLKNEAFTIYPDFPTGGFIDINDYQDGQRGGKLRMRSKIESTDKKTLLIKDLPYGVTTGTMIESIVKAAEKGKIKIKKITDNTAADVEIEVELMPGNSPDVTIDALYAFTMCEVSISPNACVIGNDRPNFTTVSEMLKHSAQQTKDLLEWELRIKQEELNESWLFASLEKIFIEKRIYRDIEECETWEAVLEAIESGLAQYIATPADEAPKTDKRLRLYRNLTAEDYTKLTEIRIKRISKFNAFQAEEKIKQLESELEQVAYDLAHLINYTISWFLRLKEKYGKGRERKTEIRSFDTIRAQEVVANNAKLYANFKEGFVGFGLKKDEFVADCSDIDDIIAFRKDGKFSVVRIADKVFVGKDLIHVAVWKKGDDRTTYNLVYLDGASGKSFAKRFQVGGITRDKEYDLTQANTNSKVFYLSSNPNGEAETLSITLSPNSTARIKQFDFDFGEIAIKGRSSQGNTLTKYPLRKVVLREIGKSTLGATQIWWDDSTGKINKDARGKLLGAFDTGDKIIALYKDGQYEINEPDINIRIEPNNILSVSKLKDETVISALYFDGLKSWTMVKRFKIETNSNGQKYNFLTEHKSSQLYFGTLGSNATLVCMWNNGKKEIEQELNLDEFVTIKGWKAAGNRLSEFALSKFHEIKTEETEPQEKFHPGDSIDFDLDKGNQGSLFE